MSLTIKIDNFGEAELRLDLPSNVCEALVNKYLGETPRELGEVWDGEEGLWVDIDGHHCDHGCRISLTMDSHMTGGPVLYLNRILRSDPLDGTAEPRLTLDDELAFIRAARMTLGEHMKEMRQ